MTLYEVELRVSYGRKVLIDSPDEDAASESVIWDEQVRIESAPGSYRVEVGHYGIRAVTRDEMEDA